MSLVSPPAQKSAPLRRTDRGTSWAHRDSGRCSVAFNCLSATTGHALYRDMRRLVAAATIGLVTVMITACTTGARSTPTGVRPAASGDRAITSSPPRTSKPTGSSIAPTSSASTASATTTTSTTVAASLPAPSGLAPLVSPALPGEGIWRPAGDRLVGGYGVYTTMLRPAAGLPPCGVAWIDTRATQMVLYAGSAEPSGSWPQQSYVGAAQQPTLIAAFNSGFKIYSYDTGWYDQGRWAVSLQNGAASLVIYANGSATVGEWGRDVAMGTGVIAVRQNLSLLVDHGAPAPAAQYPSEWGAVLGGGYSTWRSAVGVTAAGDLVYAGGPELSPALLAHLMVAAGAQRAMELDINPEWVSFATFTHTSGIGDGAPTGTNLLQGMYYSPDHYLQPYTRDFFAVLAR